ncbi:hypothetical protein D9758_005229 [Tetrapyrgos nigripes]|uniref:Cytochrome P450 n=1 Tax=Tetrapyrgos nigripes TaxID=182062 RepID=A0A8H5GWN1_9AGAR|nr:hypothetical protein D9758_005229 [Tetrapyrgos nigripes]
MSNLSTYSAYLLSAFLLFRFIRAYLGNRNSPLRKIPTIGYSSPLLSYISAFRFFTHSQRMIHEGYTKYKGHAFKIPMVNGWHVMVSGPKLIEEIKSASDEYMSLRFAADNTLQAYWQLGDYRHEPDFYLINAVRNKVTRDIAPRFEDVQDEIQAAFSDEIHIKGEEWVPVRVNETSIRVISRTSNRLFVGLPLCRDSNYRDLKIEFTVDIMIGSSILQLFPDIMKPLVTMLISKVPRQMRRATRLLRPVIEDRLEKDVEYGKDWPGRPTDLISWLIDATPASKRTVENISLQILIINFGAIHTTSIAFTSAMYCLACHPELHEPLREEIQTVIEKEGWSKSAIDRMHKLDSVLKEASRLGGHTATAMNRLVLKDFTFSDGTTIPAGTFVSAAANATHNDESIYPDAHQYRGFRFADMKSENGGVVGQSMIKTTDKYMLFGHGKHACPGRFFAVNELKTMLAHCLLNYDFKFADGRTEPPPPTWIAMSIIPDQQAEVMFRARRK